MNDETVKSIHNLIIELRRAYENDDNAELESAIEALEKAVAHVTNNNSEPVAEKDDNNNEAG